MSGGMPVFRPAPFLKSIRARMIEMNPQSQIAVAAGLLVLAVVLDGGGLVTAMVLWLLCF
jgi:hypothetical protein